MQQGRGGIGSHKHAIAGHSGRNRYLQTRIAQQLSQIKKHRHQSDMMPIRELFQRGKES